MDAETGSSYTKQDLTRAAKQLAAAMQQLHDDIHAVAEAAGMMVGIMDSLGDEPMSGSRYYHKVDALMGRLAKCYDQLADHLSRQS